MGVRGSQPITGSSMLAHLGPSSLLAYHKMEIPVIAHFFSSSFFFFFFSIHVIEVDGSKVAGYVRGGGVIQTTVYVQRAPWSCAGTRLPSQVKGHTGGEGTVTAELRS